MSVNIYVDDDLVVTQPAATVTTDTFEANVVLRDLPAGPIDIECVAQDIAAEPKTGTQRISTLFDQGPSVTITNPAKDMAVPATANVLIKVQSYALGSSDPGAAVDAASLKLRINGTVVLPKPVVNQAGSYEYQIDFTNKDVFPNSKVESAEIQVTVANQRGATNTAERNLVVDGDGPLITVVKPAQGRRRQNPCGGHHHGRTRGSRPGRLLFKITHLGVTKSYLFTHVDGPNGEPNRYRGEFQAGEYPTRSQVTLNLVARDAAGNETTGSHLIELDSVPPYVSLILLPFASSTWIRRQGTTPARILLIRSATRSTTSTPWAANAPYDSARSFGNAV